jgi:hypothetical protein
MKKFALALLVLALTVPANAAVVITMTKGAGVDANKVTVSYNNTAGEEVRAFALKIAVGNGKFSVGSPQAISTEYYVYPGSIQFAVDSNGATYISDLGTPVAAQDANGGVIEMASLYAASDPNHPSAPPSSGPLLSFRVNCQAGSPQTVTLSLDTQRGGVVLKDPNVAPTVTLPAALQVCPADVYACWNCNGQPSGDCNGSGKVDITDYFLFKKAYGTASATHPHGTGVGQYNCCCDFNHDLKVNITDYFTFKKNYGKVVGTACGDISCPL